MDVVNMKNEITIEYIKIRDEYHISNNDLDIFVKDYNIVLSEKNNNMGYINLYEKNKVYMGNINFNEIDFNILNHSIINHIKDSTSFNIFINTIKL